jgi:hypothetical protein
LAAGIDASQIGEISKQLVGIRPTLSWPTAPCSAR